MLRPDVVKAIYKARQEGLSYRDLERRFGLSPANGMNAWRAVRRYQSQHGPMFLVRMFGRFRDDVEAFCSALRFLKHEQQAQVIKKLIPLLDKKFQPAGYRELWRVGMEDREFEELLETELRPMPAYEAAKRLFGLLIGNKKRNDAAGDYMRRCMRVGANAKSGVPAIWGCSKDRYRERQRDIGVPLVYFPDKEEREKRMLGSAKKRIIGRHFDEES